MADAPSRPKQKRQPGPGLNKVVQPDDALAAIIGRQPLPRSEVVRRLWDYIRRLNLQDPADKRFIVPDENLKHVLNGESRIGMFEMTRLVFRHLH